MNNQNAVKLLTDEFHENDRVESEAVENNWTRVLTWDTHRTRDRYVRQSITVYAMAHSSKLGPLDGQDYVDYLHAEDPWERVDYGEIVFRVHEWLDAEVYDDDSEDGYMGTDCGYPDGVAYDNLIDAEKAAKDYLRNLNPEHLKPLI